MEAKSATALDVAQHRLKWRKEAEDSLQYASDIIALQMDHHRKDQPSYKAGDWVYIHAGNLNYEKNCPKFDNRYLGLFQIEKVISPIIVELKLPSHWRIHNVFHVEQLKLKMEIDYKKTPG